jgi:predicted AAA+ superfamily ATPase
MQNIRMWITRDAEQLLHRMADQFSAILVTGARQSGKTSLLRHLYPHAAYLSLDLPDLPNSGTYCSISCLQKHFLQFDNSR